MDAPWRIELFGWLRLTRGTQVVRRFRMQKVGALLGYLAYYPSRSHPREALIELLWPECDPAVGRNRLSVALSSLRRQLEPPGVPAGAVIVADHATVQLNPAAVTTDVAAFEAALRAAAQSGSAPERGERLAAAAELYRGELLPGYFEEWVLPERERQAGAFFQALEQLIRLLEQQADLPRALEWARRAVAADPLREGSHHALIRLLAAAGQAAAALRQYEELERLLDEQLGEAPAPEIRAFASSLRSGSALRAGGVEPERREAELQARAPATLSGGAAALPTGTVTFLLTDIEGSTAVWERTGAAFAEALTAHHERLRQAFREYAGHEVKEMGDAFLVAFQRAGDALACAVAGQRALATHLWSAAVGPLRVRMALHTGDMEPQEGVYHGLALHHAQRVLVTGHGGQILCSEATASLLRRDLPPEARLADLGVYRLRDVTQPERLFQVEYPEMGQREFPPLKADAAAPSHLPLQFTRFFGREEEIERLRALLGGGVGRWASGVGEVGSTPPPNAHPPTPNARLVTVMGPGGSGKTRLALEVARQLGEARRGAVWFVPLADLEDARRLAEAVRDAMRLPPSPDVAPLEQVVAVLSRQPALLVLDNFEHLVSEGAPLVGTLLERVPPLTCLVTSRQRLGLAGERQFLLRPLPTPNGTRTPEELLQCASAQLFVDRAQAVRPDFQVTRANVAALAAVCRRLEGIPLALELAAARAPMLTPSQMLARLEQGFELLVSRQRGAAARHRTLRATLDWSYELLSPELQRFFARLSVFRGGFALEAAEAVCEAPAALDDLMELRDGSLVLSEEPVAREAACGDAAGGEMRYRLLETIREYAAEKLPESAANGTPVRQRHAEYFLRLAEEQIHQLRMPDQVAALRRFQLEYDNVRTALDWCQQSGRHALCAQLALALGMFLQRRGFHQAALGRIQTGLDAARQLGAEHTRLYGELLRERAGLYLDEREWSEADRWAREARALFEQWGDPGGTADADNLLGLAAKGQRSFEEARRHYAAALQQFERLGDKVGIAKVHSNLGVVEYTDPRGSKEEAAHHWQESLRLHRVNQDKRGIAEVLNNLGVLAHELGKLDEAWGYYEQALQLEKELQHAFAIGRALCNLGEVAELKRQPQQACWLFAAAEAIFAELGSPQQQYAAELLSRAAASLEHSEAAMDALRRSLKGQPLEALTNRALTSREGALEPPFGHGDDRLG